MTKPNLVSGIQPTGRPHVGNYLGALRHFVELQNSGKYRCYFFIVDLHSLTEDFEPKKKQGQILDLAADFLAAGLDPKKSVIALQSHIPAHAEAAWILGTLTPMGELERMTQFKDKSDAQKQNINAGLFTYPILMAVDVLLYDTKVVPVGDDQLQHLELTRTLARKFNKKFGKTFIEPKALLTETPRVMPLDDPTKKMSKSRPKGCLFLDDTPKDIKEKIQRAVTDSGTDIIYAPEKKPAMSNLLQIYSSLSGESFTALERQFANKGYAEFKSSFAKLVTEHFAEFRKKKAALKKNPALLKKTLASGSARAAKVADKKMAEVKKKVGIHLT